MKFLKKERATLENTAEKLLSLALSAGAQKAEVCASYGQKTRIGLEKQDYHLASSDDGYQFGIRVLQGQKQGFASCNTTDPKELKEVALRAVEIAGFSPPNPHVDILESGNIPSEAPTEIFDTALHQVSLQTQRDWTKLLADEAMRDKRLKLNEGSFEIGSSLFLVMNSLGTHKIEKETAAGWSLMGMAAEGDRMTSFDYFSDLARKAEGIPDRLVNSARKFRTELIDTLHQGPAETYKGVVIFSPRAALEILVDSISYHFNGRNLVEGTSRWKLEELGKKLFHPSFHLKDDPWKTDRAGCTLFDREGTPARPLSLVESGEWKNVLLDHYAAKALGRSSTGHAVGGPSSLPALSSHSLCVGAGKTPIAGLLKDVATRQKQVLIVHRYSGQADPITGDFSGVAKGGEWWINGERAYFVQETLISGNVFDALEKSLVGLSAETEVVDASQECPTFAIDGVSVTSGAKK
jgi:PmbA protein